MVTVAIRSIRFLLVSPHWWNTILGLEAAWGWRGAACAVVSSLPKRYRGDTTYIHITHTYIYIHIHTYIHTYIHTLHYITLHYITLHYITYIHTYIHTYTHIYIYMHIDYIHVIIHVHPWHYLGYSIHMKIISQIVSCIIMDYHGLSWFSITWPN